MLVRLWSEARSAAASAHSAPFALGDVAGDDAAAEAADVLALPDVVVLLELQAARNSPAPSATTTTTVFQQAGLVTMTRFMSAESRQRATRSSPLTGYLLRGGPPQPFQQVPADPLGHLEPNGRLPAS